MDLVLTIIEENDRLNHLKLSGRLDYSGESTIRERMLDLAGQGKPLLIDLAGLRYLGSVGLGMLFECGKKLSEQGLKMMILNPQVIVAQVLDCSGVSGLLETENDYDRAVHRLIGSR